LPQETKYFHPVDPCYGAQYRWNGYI